MTDFFKTQVKEKDIQYLYSTNIRDGEVLLDLIQIDDAKLGSVYSHFERIDNGSQFSTNFKIYFKPNLNLYKRLIVGNENYTILSSTRNEIHFKDDLREYRVTLSSFPKVNKKSLEIDIDIETKGEHDSERTFKRHLSSHMSNVDKLINSLLKSYQKVNNSEKGVKFTYLMEYDSDLNSEFEESDSGFDTMIHGSSTNKISDLEKTILNDDSQIDFSSIGGLKQAKLELSKIVQDFVSPELGAFFGRDPTEKKGYLLYGNPGCGKTLLVKALISELKKVLNDKIKIYSINYSDLADVYRGGEAIKTREIFDNIEKNESTGIKSLLFIDELQSIMKGKQNDDREILDTLLAKLDGTKSYKNFVIIGSTYLALDNIDKALIRDGRLENKIHIPNPDLEGREEIFKIHINKRKKIAEKINSNLFSDIDFSILAGKSDGLNGSHIRGIINKIISEKEKSMTDSLIGKNIDLKDIEKEFKPIQTEDIVKIIEDYQKNNRTKSIGFKVN